jgi:hypothetical protein
VALYEGLKSSSDQAASRPSRPALRPLPVYEPRVERPWRELHHERADAKSSGSFLDNLLGAGSQAKVATALRPAKKVQNPPARQAWSSSKVEAVGSGQRSVPRGKKGMGRAVIVLMVMAWGLVRLHPWTRMHLGHFGFADIKTEIGAVRVGAGDSPVPTRTAGWTADLESLFKPADDPAKAQAAAQQDEAAKQKEAEDASHLAALPVDPAGGTALALWQDGAGHWWQVNGSAELRPCNGPADKDSLGLPEIRGVASQAEEHGQGKRLSLKLPEGLLKTLLPLEPSVASEVRAVLLDDPSVPALLTHDGTRCLLDATDWERCQRHLGLVLADLAAKKRRAALIDLRYEDTAVVRPAGRV